MNLLATKPKPQNRDPCKKKYSHSTTVMATSLFLQPVQQEVHLGQVWVRFQMSSLSVKTKKFSRPDESSIIEISRNYSNTGTQTSSKASKFSFTASEL